MIKSFDNRPIPGVMCLLPKAGVREAIFLDLVRFEVDFLRAEIADLDMMRYIRAFV
jgi:hypothetical protein